MSAVSSAADFRKILNKDVAEIVQDLLDKGATVTRTSKGHFFIKSSINDETMGVSRNSGSGHIPIHKVRLDALRLYPEQTDRVTISRSDLRGFDKDCQQLIIKAVNEYGWSCHKHGKGLIEIVAADGKKLTFSPGTKPINPSLNALRRTVLQHGTFDSNFVTSSARTSESITAHDTVQAAGASETVEEETVKTKVCTKCGETKPLTAFGNRKASRDGLQYWCRPCNNAASRTARMKAEDEELKVASEATVAVEVTADEVAYDDLVKLAKIREILGEDPRVSRLAEELKTARLRITELDEKLEAVKTERDEHKSRAEELSNSLGALRELITGIDTDGSSK